MAEPITVIRQMMADGKLLEAQVEAERQLSLQVLSRVEVLPLYLDILTLQNKNPPVGLNLEVAEIFMNSDLNRAEVLLKKVKGEELLKSYRRIQGFKIKIAEMKGHTEELYKLISEYQVFLYEAQIPLLSENVNAHIEKYFKDDFQLKLQRLSLILLLNDFDKAEIIIHDLIQSCVEKSSPKGTKGKIYSLYEVLRTQKERGYLEMYLNFCQIYLDGIKEKKDYKKIIELIIYIDDVKFQAQILKLLDLLELGELAQDYANEIKNNEAYSYVYFDKYYSHLKKYLFISKNVSVKKNKAPLEEMDLTLEENSKEEEASTFVRDNTDEVEDHFINVLKHQNNTAQDLMEIAVSFLESDYPRAAVKAAEMVKGMVLNDDVIYLNASYLKITGQIQLQDYRAALDTTMEALKRARNTDDILSFLYTQAEIYLKLKNNSQAKEIFKKILSVDSKYRLAKEKFEKLNEV